MKRISHMNRVRVAAMVGAGMILMTAPALAGLPGMPGQHPMKLAPQVEQIRYRRDVLPEAIIGGVISGVLGGVIGGNCYFNDCGYDGGPYYGDPYFVCLLYKS